MNIDIGQLKFIDAKLREMARRLEEKTGIEVTITSLYRIDDTGVHGQLPVRGMDLRVRYKSIGEALVELVNDTWIYDPARPHLRCAVLHGEGVNLHLHLQVHPNTRYVAS